MCWIIEMIHGCLIKNKTNRKRPIIAEFLIRWFRSMRVHRPEWARKSTEKTILNGNWHTRRPQATINRMHSIKQPNKIQSKKTDAHTEIIYDGNLFIQIVVCSEDLIDTTVTDTRESCQRSMDKYKSRKLSQPWGIHIYRKNILPPNACGSICGTKASLSFKFSKLGLLSTNLTIHAPIGAKAFVLTFVWFCSTYWIVHPKMMSALLQQ